MFTATRWALVSAQTVDADQRAWCWSPTYFVVGQGKIPTNLTRIVYPHQADRTAALLSGEVDS